ncbi:MAG: hypothetical protein JW881_21285 [Spirochaetales bacterium]|nr:hypothetical protein [Spirochaetales bacterium]
MKRTAATIFLAVISVSFIYADVGFSGDLTLSLTSYLAFPYNDERFDTLINPGNYAGVKDLSLSHTITAKLDGSDEASLSTFSLWCAFDTYRIAEALFAAAAGDPAQTAAVSETLPFLGASFGTVEVIRANVAFYAGDAVRLCAGRQQMYTGYGYGWNPIDFANPIKNPYSPEAELMGVDGIKATLTADNTASTSISCIISGDTPGGIDFRDAAIVSENTLRFPDVEMVLNGLYEYDGHEGEDGVPSALGCGIKANVFDIGVYGEAALRFGSRKRYYDLPSAEPAVKTEAVFSGLAGIEYVFPGETALVLEYFYNGEGMSEKEKTDYEEIVEAAVGAAGAPSATQIGMIVPGYINRHYILCRLEYPLYDIDSDAELTVIFSPDGLMLNVLPAFSVSVTGNLTVTAGYTGLFDFDGNRINEASLSPASHMAEIKAVYYF